jgi:hypothetical protein
MSKLLTILIPTLALVSGVLAGTILNSVLEARHADETLAAIIVTQCHRLEASVAVTREGRVWGPLTNDELENLATTLPEIGKMHITLPCHEIIT